MRVTTSELRDIFPGRAEDMPNLEPFIIAADLIVDEVVNVGGTKVSTELAKEITRWLAAHFLAIQQQLPENETIGDGEVSYQGKTGMALDATLYGQQAKLLDPTGVLDRRTRERKQWAIENIGTV